MGDLSHEAGLHEIVLHIDNQQGCLRRIDGVEGMRTPRTLRYTLKQLRRDREFMHQLFSAFCNDSAVALSDQLAHQAGRRASFILDENMGEACTKVWPSGYCNISILYTINEEMQFHASGLP